jgi:AmmeMemoRadiSam system protein A
MARLPSPEPRAIGEREALLALARASIEHGVHTGLPLAVDLLALPPGLRAPGAAFVTLHRHGELRGCTGELEARQPLAASVAHQAFSAAFRDPRFAPLASAELADLDVHISILGPLSPLDVGSLAELIAALRPGIDGLLIDDGLHRATFLPAVWESLPEPLTFACELWRKAGLASGAWPAELRAWRYEVESIAHLKT